MARRNLETLQSATEEFSAAVALDSEYASAHAALSIATNLLVDYGELTFSEADAIKLPHAERALALDPGLAEAHAAMALVLWKQETLVEA